LVLFALRKYWLSKLSILGKYKGNDSKKEREKESKKEENGEWEKDRKTEREKRENERKRGNDSDIFLGNLSLFPTLLIKHGETKLASQRKTQKEFNSKGC
jgi:hypothetical protein